MPEYTDAHKYFLQAMMQKGVVTEQECKALLVESCETVGDDATEYKLNSVIALINKKIQPFHLEIRKGINEDDGLDIYALISITDHDINHLAIGGYFSKTEIEIFRRMVDLIVGSPDGVVSSTEVLNITEDLGQKTISKADVELLISKLVKQQWIGENDGIVFLTARSVLELEPYLKNQPQDIIVYCCICKNMVLRGLRCSSCRSKIHNYCAATYFRGRSESERKCPSCYASMSYHTYSATSNNVNGTLDQLPSTSERRKRRR